MFLIQFGLKEAEALSLLLCNLISEYDIMKDRNPEKLEMEGTYQVLTYADNVKTLSEKRNTTKKTQMSDGRLVWRLV
jgi:hypothetical protein